MTGGSTTIGGLLILKVETVIGGYYVITTAKKSRKADQYFFFTESSEVAGVAVSCAQTGTAGVYQITASEGVVVATGAVCRIVESIEGD